MATATITAATTMVNTGVAAAPLRKTRPQKNLLTPVGDTPTDTTEATIMIILLTIALIPITADTTRPRLTHIDITKSKT